MNHTTVLPTEKAHAEFLALVDHLTIGQKAVLRTILKVLLKNKQGGAQ